jgi:hypothetical protein
MPVLTEAHLNLDNPVSFWSVCCLRLDPARYRGARHPCARAVPCNKAGLLEHALRESNLSFAEAKNEGEEPFADERGVGSVRFPDDLERRSGRGGEARLRGQAAALRGGVDEGSHGVA